MHKESYKITKETAKKLNELKSKNCPIFAIGTTVARCLESNLKNDLFMPEIGSTNLFIYPGYILILVSSFSTKNKIKEYYDFAIVNNMKFFSFGDAMLLDKYEF